MKKLLCLVFIFIVVCGLANAQKITLTSGEVSDLKGLKQMLVEYDYSTMGVGDFATEAEYVDTKVAEYNEKENKKGDKWLKAWQGARKTKYQPKFEEVFNKVGSKKGMTVSQKAKKAKYVLIVKTIFLEPGFNIGIMKKPSQVSFDFIIVDIENRTNIIAEFHLEKVKGASASGFDFDSAARVSESYAKAGKIFAKYLLKYAK